MTILNIFPNLIFQSNRRSEIDSFTLGDLKDQLYRSMFCPHSKLQMLHLLPVSLNRTFCFPVTQVGVIFHRYDSKGRTV